MSTFAQASRQVVPAKPSKNSNPTRTGARRACCQERSSHDSLTMHGAMHGATLSSAKPTAIQMKPQVGPPGDRYEREADRMAERVMSMSGPVSPVQSVPTATVQRSCETCAREQIDEQQTSGSTPRAANAASEEEEEELVQAKAANGSGMATTTPGDLGTNIRALQNGGHAMPATDRRFFEGRFGTDFSDVRLHTDTHAANTARSISARAFTVGSHVAFGRGQYAPNGYGGRMLLAHELTHVLQQRGKGAQPIRRHVLENDPATAPTMSCPVATTPAQGVSLDVTFTLGGHTLTDADKLAVSNFVANWHVAPVTEEVRVDGFASIDGRPSTNWPLSCLRAETLANELKSPSDGTPGIPGQHVKMHANGETNRFGTALGPNRRAQAHIPNAPVTPHAITSRTLEASPGARTRTTIGVAERVELTHSAGSVAWSTTAGTLSAPNGASIILTAPDTAQTVTVTGDRLTKAFTVVAPTSVSMARQGASGVKHNQNFPDSGMLVDVFLGPDTVNFSRAQYRELDVPATTSGTYSCHNGKGHCTAVGGACATKALTSTVTAGRGTKSTLGDCAYSGHCAGSAPFTPGSVLFRIPYQYRVGTGAFRRITTVTQLHMLLPGGTVLTTTKAGAFAVTTVAAATVTIATCP